MFVPYHSPMRNQSPSHLYTQGSPTRLLLNDPYSSQPRIDSNIYCIYSIISHLVKSNEPQNSSYFPDK